MRSVLLIAVAVIVIAPDDDASVCAPLADNPLDELAARLRHETCYGRDGNHRPAKMPDVTVAATAAYSECLG